MSVIVDKTLYCMRVLDAFYSLKHSSKLSRLNILTIRTITDYFSYNGRYENATLKRIGLTEIPVIHGQFGEHFERKSGGFYIRTIGYVLDENGYRQFVVDLSTAQTNITQVETTPEPVVIPTTGGKPESSTVSIPFPISAPVGGPGAGKGGISSTTLGTLIGGNSLVDPEGAKIKPADLVKSQKRKIKKEFTNQKT